MAWRFPLHDPTTALLFFLVVISHDSLIQKAVATNVGNTVCTSSIYGGTSLTDDWYSVIPFPVPNLLLDLGDGSFACAMPSPTILASDCLLAGTHHLEGNSNPMPNGWNLPLWSWRDNQHRVKDSPMSMYIAVPAANCFVDFTGFNLIGLTLFSPTQAAIDSDEAAREANKEAAANFRARMLENRQNGVNFPKDASENENRGVELEQDSPDVPQHPPVGMGARSQRYMSETSWKAQLNAEKRAQSAQDEEYHDIDLERKQGPVEEHEVAQSSRAIGVAIAIIGLILAFAAFERQVYRSQIGEISFLADRSDSWAAVVFRTDASTLHTRNWLGNTCWCTGCPSEENRKLFTEEQQQELGPEWDKCCDGGEYRSDIHNGRLIAQNTNQGSGALYNQALVTSHPAIAQYQFYPDLSLRPGADGKNIAFESGLRMNEGKTPLMIAVLAVEHKGELHCMPMKLVNAPIVFRTRSPFFTIFATTAGAALVLGGGYAYKREKDKKDARAKRRADRRAKRAARKSAGAAGTSGSRGSRKSIGSSKAVRSSSKARSTGSRKSARSNRA